MGLAPTLVGSCLGVAKYIQVSQKRTTFENLNTLTPKLKVLNNESYFPAVSGSATNLDELAPKVRHLIAKGASPGYKTF